MGVKAYMCTHTHTHTYTRTHIDDDCNKLVRKAFRFPFLFTYFIVIDVKFFVLICSADQALDRFAMKRFYDDKLGGLTQPSQRR